MLAAHPLGSRINFWKARHQAVFLDHSFYMLGQYWLTKFLGQRISNRFERCRVHHFNFLRVVYYKIRLAIASKQKGKSGGARVITNFVIADATVYLLSIYDKSEKENLTDKELDELLKFVPE